MKDQKMKISFLNVIIYRQLLVRLFLDSSLIAYIFGFVNPLFPVVTEGGYNFSLLRRCHTSKLVSQL